MNRKTGAVAAALVVVAVSALTGCSRPGASDDGPSPVIRLAAGVDPSYTPVYVAVDQGYFEDEGLDVEYFTTEGGPSMSQAVIAGEADVAVQSDATTVSLMPSAPQLRGLASFEQSDTYIKVVHGKGVDSAKDIKKLATVDGVMTLAAVRYLESEGIDPESVEIVDAPPPDLPAILTRGDADATVIFEPWAARAAEEAQGKIVATIGDFGMSYSQWVVSTDDWVSENEAEAAKVLKAIERADAFIRENPDEAARITEEMIQTPAEQTLEIMKELEFEMSDLDQADLDAATATAEFFLERGSIEKAPDLETQMLLGFYAGKQ